MRAIAGQVRQLLRGGDSEGALRGACESAPVGATSESVKVCVFICFCVSGRLGCWFVGVGAQARKLEEFLNKDCVNGVWFGDLILTLCCCRNSIFKLSPRSCNPSRLRK